MEEAANKTLTPTFYTREQHTLRPEQFDRKALKIANQLIDAGFEAYLVGGCLRDLLIEHQPKDIDIATNARPEEIAGLFRNCRLIGRRFRLAHIHFGRDIIEVATFRAAADDQVKTDTEGRVIEDNHYGNMEDDVIRRDFTINSLYYEPRKEILIDYLGAVKDIQNQTIRLIGNPETRYIEDPVRMLRAARFSAKLGMQIEAETEAAIAKCKDGLKAVPAARLFDEAQKLFMSGYGVKSFESLRRLNLFGALFPDVDRILNHPNKAFAKYAENIIKIALSNTDKRIAEDKPVTIAFLFAAFLWPVYQLQYQGLLSERDNWHSAMHEAVDLVHIAAAERVSIPVRLRGMIREIWTLQARFDLTGNNQKKTRSLLSHPRFRAAYDFLLIREEAGEALKASVRWWSRMQTSPETAFSSEQISSSNKRSSHCRRPRRKKSNSF
ncbi:polynucleotide adenylyltransferase PcnB [Suttonella ornithocola]|uniref:Poly(A) polymerase I n=1 Tax=Suttonella ornithocola TaxID=279832 RepID=A0A380MZJ1_9GAMM|nr:polynucleotide adenylyltransferase PcnB [Suttonella ornithocola]SUO96897.1 Poly(A) polymerase precursor [Suttonella ornithocola]